MFKKLIIVTVILACGSINSSIAADEFDEEEKLPVGTVRSDQLLSGGHHSSALHLLLEAQEAKRYGRKEKALALVRQALAVDPDDIEAHCFYAEMLEAKLRSGEEKSPEAFKDCIKEWLLILRNEVGAEKGMTAHGIGIPGMGKFYEDEEHTIEARQRLVRLAGSAPKPWETDKHYLKRAVPSAEASVSAKIIKEQ